MESSFLGWESDVPHAIKALKIFTYRRKLLGQKRTLYVATADLNIDIQFIDYQSKGNIGGLNNAIGSEPSNWTLARKLIAPDVDSLKNNIYKRKFSSSLEISRNILPRKRMLFMTSLCLAFTQDCRYRYGKYQH